MAGPGIGATLVLKAGEFFANAKKAVNETEKIKKSAKGATKKVKEHGDMWKSTAKKVAGAVGAYVSVREIVDFSKECIDAANTQIRAEERLDQLMMNVAGTTKSAVDAVKEYSSALQSVTTVGDEATIQGASQLATFQLQSDTIKKLLPSLQDLAVSQYGISVSGDQMQQMANLVGKVMTGNVGSLTRYGVTLNEAQKKILKTGNEAEKAAALVEVLGQNFGGLAERMAKTPEGSIVQIKNAWGDVKEVIGTKLYPVVTNFFNYLSDKLPEATDWVLLAVDKAAPYAEKGVELITKASEKLFKVLEWIKGNWGWVAPAAGGIMGLYGAYKLLNAAMVVNSNVTKIAVGIKKGWKAAAKVAKVAWKVTTLAAKGIWKVTTLAAKGIWTVAKGAAKGIWAVMKPILASPITWVIVGIIALVAAVVILWKKCKPFRDFWINMWDKIKSACGRAKDWIVDKFGIIMEKIQKFIDKIKGAINWVKELFGFGGDEKKITVSRREQITAASPGGLASTVTVEMPDLSPSVPQLAKGGVIASAGRVLVGERGPEFLDLPRGAKVTPLEKAGNTNNNTFYINIYPNELDDEAINKFVGKVKFAMANM